MSMVLGNSGTYIEAQFYTKVRCMSSLNMYGKLLGTLDRISRVRLYVCLLCICLVKVLGNMIEYQGKFYYYNVSQTWFVYSNIVIFTSVMCVTIICVWVCMYFYGCSIFLNLK